MRIGTSLTEKVMKVSISDAEEVVGMVKAEVTRADHQRLINSAESENSVAFLVHIREVTMWWGQALDWGPRQLKAYSGCYVLRCLLTGNVHHVQNTSLQTSLVSNTYARNATLMWT